MEAVGSAAVVNMTVLAVGIAVAVVAQLTLFTLFEAPVVVSSSGLVPVLVQLYMRIDTVKYYCMLSNYF